MKNVTLIALAAFTIAAPSIALAQSFSHNGNGHTQVIKGPPIKNDRGPNIIKIDGPDRNNRPDIILIDGKDRDHRPDKIIINNDDNYRYDYGRHKYYQSHRGNYYGPTRFHGNNKCGYGKVSYFLPNGRKTYDTVYMCKRRGEWVIVDR